MRIATRQFAAALTLVGVMGTACTQTPSAAPSATPPVAVSTSGPTLTATSTSPSATTLPAPTVFVPESDAFTAGLTYTCGGADFPIEVLEAPGDDHLSTDPPARYVRSAAFVPQVTEWWLIDRTSVLAEYVGRYDADSYEYFRVEFDGDIWLMSGYGDCRVRAEVPDETVIGWWIPEARWPEPGDRELRVTVRAECPETVAERLAEPIIRYGPEAIVIILAAEPLGRPHPHCGDGSDQLARVTLRLDDAVGNRSLWDGREWPLRDARSQTEPLIFCCG